MYVTMKKSIKNVHKECKEIDCHSHTVWYCNQLAQEIEVPERDGETDFRKTINLKDFLSLKLQLVEEYVFLFLSFYIYIYIILI
jgi:hypothetical protein